MLADMLRYLPAAALTPSQPVLRPGERMLAIGDSITEAGGYLRMIDAVLARQYPHLRLPPIRNAGIGGNRSGDLRRRFHADVLAHRPDRVLINVGVNDVWHNLGLPNDDGILAGYRADLDAMVRQALGQGAAVLLLSPTVIEERPESPGNRRLTRCVAAMRDVAAENGCDFCDLHGLFLAALAANPKPQNWLTTDGVHMRPRGDAVMAIGVLRSLGVPDDRIAACGVS